MLDVDADFLAIDRQDVEAYLPQAVDPNRLPLRSLPTLDLQVDVIEHLENLV